MRRRGGQWNPRLVVIRPRPVVLRDGAQRLHERVPVPIPGRRRGGRARQPEHLLVVHVRLFEVHPKATPHQMRLAVSEEGGGGTDDEPADGAQVGRHDEVRAPEPSSTLGLLILDDQVFFC